MKTLLMAAALAIIPRAPVEETRVDVIEINHFYCEEGQPIFDQIIYWDWCDAACRFQVRAWRLANRRGVSPVRRAGGYAALWLDGNDMRRVRAPAARETWTQFDPELVERSILSRDARKELGGRR